MMRIAELILHKRDGGRFSDDEIGALIDAYSRDELPDYQMAALAMAIYFQGLDRQELRAWTQAMIDSGVVLNWQGVAPGPVVDKHSTGGVGDKVSLVLAPVAATLGMTVPMISGRGLGHTGGTLDKLEAIPGFRVALSPEEFRSVVAEHRVAIVGQTEDIVPADRRLYALRDVTGTVASVPLIASSILSKKLAEGLDALVLDIKVGSGAFMRELGQARELARTMIELGQDMGVTTRVLLTDMNQPLGLAVGNALELRESLDTLSGHGPEDLVTLVCALAAEMLHAAGLIDDREEGHRRALNTLRDGSAMATFRAMVAAQGGDQRALDDPSRIVAAERQTQVLAPRGGVITGFDCLAVGRVAMSLGAGRAKASDPIDHGVGVVLSAKRGDRVKAGDVLATLHHRAAQDPEAASAALINAVDLGDRLDGATPLILDRL